MEVFPPRATLLVQSAYGGARHQREFCLGGDILLARRQKSRLQITKLSEYKQTYSIHSGSCSYMESTGPHIGNTDGTGQKILMVKRKKKSLNFKLNWLISPCF